MEEPDVYTQVECTNCKSHGCHEKDGLFYCNYCDILIEDIIETGVPDEDFVPTDTRAGGLHYISKHKCYVPSSQPTINIKLEKFDSTTTDHMGPIEPADFGDGPKGIKFSEQDYFESIRMRYVLGLQLLVQYQCEALVQKFEVNPIVCGIAAEVWLRLVVSTKVFDLSWADKTIANSEQASSAKLNAKDDAENAFTSPPLNGESKERVSSAHKFESDCGELLKNLEKRYDGLNYQYEYVKDLRTYLQYCKDVVFVGLKPLYKDPGLIEELWEFYQRNGEGKRRRDSNDVFCAATEKKKHSHQVMKMGLCSKRMALSTATATSTLLKIQSCIKLHQVVR